MDEVTAHPPILERRIGPQQDLSDPSLLPAEARLDMPEQDFSRRVHLTREPRRRVYWVPRVAVFAGAALLTLAFGYELYAVLSFAQITPFQLLFLFLSTISFGWIALGSLSAALGFLPLFAGEKVDTIELPEDAGRPLASRTALLFPVYHEDPARIAGTIEAMALELDALGHAGSFDVFILSDTRGIDAGEAEEAAYASLRHKLADDIRVFYRRRRENKARKAGNIKDWVERFGADYAHFVILDGDSVMSGRTLVRLAAAMEGDRKVGLIQTVPKLAGGNSVLQRLQQFASDTYGPTVAAGIAFWHRDQGNYWGHNAIIRTAAFAGAAGLPDLPGAAPFGGHIQSHDFVEAVLLQRAGWGVHMVPTVEGSYEGLPPSLLELVMRDRRWAQGNLQHLSIVAKRGITRMGRLHLAMGAFSYLVSAIWAASLVVGVVLALQGQQVIPSYFEDSKTLFPIWPTIDPGAALRLFLATMAIVLLPKVLGLVLAVKRARATRELGGTSRAVAGVTVETIFSMLLAPILMATQTVAVVQIVLGMDSGWKAQQRDLGGMSFRTAVDFHWRHMVLGVALTLVCWYVTPELIGWMAPVIIGLAFAGPLSWFVARPAGPILAAVLSTPEDRDPPLILERTRLFASEWSARLSPGAASGGETGRLARAA